MTDNYDTISNTTGEILQGNDVIYQEQPPSYTPPEQEEYGASSKKNSSQDATEKTHLLSNNNNTSSYNLPRQSIINKGQRNVYLPTPNLSYSPLGISGERYYQQHEIIAFRTTIPLENLSTTPAITICPHCNNIVLSNIQYKSGSCTWLSCFIISHTLVAACFIPFCVDDLKDVVQISLSCITFSKVGIN